MQNMEQVFLSMKEEIEKQANAQEKQILDEVDRLEKEAYESMKEEAQKDAELQLKQIVSEMTSNASSEISESHIERTKKLIEKRDGYVKDIFDQAISQLNDFASSNQYKDFMIEKMKKVAKDYQLPHSVLHLRKADEVLKDDLIKVYGQDIDVVIDDKISIGGFIMENQESSMIIDETLDFALENQKEWFNKNSGLIIK